MHIHEAPSPPPSLPLTPPAPPAHFTGREETIAAIKTALQAGEATAITALAGMGGIGKTTLAQKLAAELAGDFPGGVLWSELGREPPALPLALGRWARYCGREIADLSDVDAVCAAVRALLAGRGRMLIILDDVWTEEPARTLIKLRPDGAALLVTTRDSHLARQLRCQVREIDRLSEAESVTLLGKLLGNLGVFEGAAREIVRLLGGHPLALELAAGQVDGADELPGLAEKLRGKPSLSHLKVGEGRQDDVEATLALSYGALDEDMQRRFRALGVFAEDAPFDALAASAVWHDATGEEGAGETTQDALRLLVRRAMLQRAGSPALYRQHLVPRMYARALLHEAGEQAETGDRHADHYLARVDRDREDWQAIDAMLPQVRAAWAQVQASDDHERVMGFVWALRIFFDRRGLLDNWLAWAERGRISAEATEDLHALSSMLVHIGTIFATRGDMGLALDHFQRALAIRQDVGDREGEATALNNIGYVYRQRGELGEALDHFQRALAIRQDVGDREGEAVTLNNLGTIYRERGDLELALDHYRRALTICEEESDRSGEATTLHNLGTIYYRRGDLEPAMGYYQRAVTIRQDVGDREGEATTLNNIGLVYHARGELGEALDHFQRALAIYTEVSGRAGEAVTSFNLGRLLDRMGRTAEAIPYVERTVEIDRMMSHAGLERHQRELDALRAKLGAAPGA